MEEIYDKYFEKIYKWSLKKTNNKEDAEDLTNNVFLSIFEYINKNIEIEKLDNLIWKIAYNLWCTKAKEYIKNNQNITINEDLSDITKVNMIDKIIYKEIIDNLDCYKLTKNEKESFELYYFQDLSIKEIALKLNSNESNIKYYLYSARNKIKERYNE
jgi:RNA polymerase sigma-70 factor (ECF subfamily)